MYGTGVTLVLVFTMFLMLQSILTLTMGIFTYNIKYDLTRRRVFNEGNSNKR